jgi:hypothetical protein
MIHLGLLWYYIYMGPFIPPTVEHLTESNTLPYAQRLYDRGSREAILEFLQWNDPNGVYTDTVSKAEGYESLSYDEALIELEGIINDLMEPAVLEPTV